MQYPQNYLPCGMLTNIATELQKCFGNYKNKIAEENNSTNIDVYKGCQFLRYCTSSVVVNSMDLKQPMKESVKIPPLWQAGKEIVNWTSLEVFI